MKRLILAAALMLAAGAAMAEDEAVLGRGKNVMRLQSRPCIHGGTLALLKPEWREKFRQARAIVDGKDLFACWIAQPNGTVMVLFEDGRFAELPISEFQKDEGI